MALHCQATSGARNTTWRSGFQRAGMYKKTHQKKDSLSLSSHDADSHSYSVENRFVAGQQNLPRKSVPPFIHKIVFIIAESIQVVKARAVSHRCQFDAGRETRPLQFIQNVS